MTEIHRKEFLGHPAGLYVLFFTEMWERFSYYGMRALLVLYVSTSATAEDPGMGWSTKEALVLYGWYTMLVYLLSIPGGILADRFLGQKKTVMLGGLLLVVGHTTLAIHSDMAFFSGLALIVLGVGCLKPNISTMVGRLYKQGDIRRDKGFSIFYVGINTGALLSGIIVGIVASEYGWHYGFGLAGVGMALGQIVYISGQRYLIGVGESPSKRDLGEVEDTPKKLTSVERDRIIVLLISFLILIVFWGAYEQAGGLMNLYTDIKVDRATGIDTTISWLREIPTVVFQSLNSTYIILFASLLAGFWAWVRKVGGEASSIFKMGVGTAIMGIGFLFMVLASNEASSEPFGKASMVWIFLTYLLHTIGELCSSPVAMSFITKLAPVRYGSIMMGIFFAMTGFGNKIAAMIGESSQTDPYYAKVIASEDHLNTIKGKPLEGKNFEIKSDVFLKEGNFIFRTHGYNRSLENIFSLDNNSSKRLKKVLDEENVSEDAPYHARLLFEIDKVISDAVKEGQRHYSISFVLEEVQNKRERKTFLYITAFTVIVSAILILLLKKLKKLTHGVEEEEMLKTA